MKSGQIAALIGPNGCGKSTLLKSFLGFAKKFDGDVLLDGERITNRRPHEIIQRGVGYVPQIDNVFPNLTIEENLQLGYYIRHDKKLAAEVEEMLRLFPSLQKRRRQKAAVLSGGERQMLAIARALMPKPKLLFLDEPTASLSPKSTSEVMDKIRVIRDTGVTILQVEQNVKRALEVSDEVHVMFAGKIILEGKPEEILKDHNLGEIFLGVLPSGTMVG